jgi:hypothetical protein
VGYGQSPSFQCFAYSKVICVDFLGEIEI